MDEKAIKEKIHTLKGQLLAISEDKVAKIPYNSKRCTVCEMFFSEDISIRKKTHVYGSLYVCWQCFNESKENIDEMVKDIKAKEREKDVS